MLTEVYFVGKYKVKGVENYASVKECVEYLETLKEVGLDIETTRKFKVGTYDERVYQGGLDPYLSRIVMIQVGSVERTYVIDVRDFNKRGLKPLLDFLDWNDSVQFIGHNLKFEGRHLNHNYGINLKNVHDTMVTEIVLTNGLPLKYGLANLAQRYLKVPIKKEATLFDDLIDYTKVTLNDEFLEDNEYLLTPFEVEDNYYIDKSTRMQFLNIGKKPFTKTQILYGSDDIVLPILIKERQLLGRKIDKDEVYLPTKLIKIENAFTQVIADVENNGMSFVPKMWEDVATKAEQTLEERTKKLNKYVTTLYPDLAQLNLFTPEHDCAIEWSSSKQVIYLFRRLGFCPKEYSKETKRKDYTVGAKALLKLVPNDLKENYLKDNWVDPPMKDGQYVEDHNYLMLMYLLVSKAEQAVSTFGRAWLKNVHPISKRVHTSFRQILNTGRLSSSNPNMQNISGGEYRDCFVVGEGEIMINTDYAAQELRVLADKSEDRIFMDFFINGHPFFGEDFHAFTATKVFSMMRGDPDFVVPPKELPLTGEDNPDFTKEHKTMRDKSKTINFGIAYGKEALAFSFDLGLSVEDTETFLDSYLLIYEDLAKYFESQKKKAETIPYIQIDEFTDRRWFNPYFDEMQNAKKEAQAYYPEDFRYKSKKEREEFKLWLKETHPEVSLLWKKYFSLLGQYARKFLNYPIQGGASSILKIGMCGLRNEYIEKGYKDFKLTNFVHDEVLAEVPQDKGDLYGEMLSRWMIKGGIYICKKVPMVADYKLYKSWKH